QQPLGDVDGLEQCPGLPIRMPRHRTHFRALTLSVTCLQVGHYRLDAGFGGAVPAAGVGDLPAGPTDDATDQRAHYVGAVTLELLPGTGRGAAVLRETCRCGIDTLGQLDLAIA